MCLSTEEAVCSMTSARMGHREIPWSPVPSSWERRLSKWKRRSSWGSCKVQPRAWGWPWYRRCSCTSGGQVPSWSPGPSPLVLSEALWSRWFTHGNTSLCYLHLKARAAWQGVRHRVRALFLSNAENLVPFRYLLKFDMEAAQTFVSSWTASFVAFLFQLGRL